MERQRQAEERRKGRERLIPANVRGSLVPALAGLLSHSLSLGREKWASLLTKTHIPAAADAEAPCIPASSQEQAH